MLTAKKGDELPRNGPQCLCEIFFFFIFFYVFNAAPVEGQRSEFCIASWAKKLAVYEILRNFDDICIGLDKILQRCLQTDNTEIHG